MKAVLLAGGLGTRMREETEFRPKPMVDIGGQPVLWHIMKILSAQGINDFVICAGYKAEVIKNYFLSYGTPKGDFTVTLGQSDSLVMHQVETSENWRVTVVDTGLETQTAGRIRRVRDYLDGDDFLCTYGDGIADVDLNQLLDNHVRAGKIATMTITRPVSRFGVVDLDSEGLVKSFREKPLQNDWINMGYFIFKPEIFSYLDVGDEVPFEDGPLRNLVSDGQLASNPHEKFWLPMDTYREYQVLNELWDSGHAPWASWIASS